MLTVTAKHWFAWANFCLRTALRKRSARVNGIVEFGGSEDDGEFLASVTAQYVGRAQPKAEPFDQFDEYGVTRRVSVGIVDFLEVVDVEQ